MPSSSVSADLETPPDGTRAIDPEKHKARVRVAMGLFRGRGRGATIGRTDLGGVMSLLGITVGVPAFFMSPFLQPMILGFSGMACCLIGLTISRDKLIGALGILLAGASAGGGVAFHEDVRTIYQHLGLIEKEAPPPEPYGNDNLVDNPDNAADGPGD